MLILVRPSSTLMWTTSPIAAAGATVGSRPGAGSSTMPRTTLSFFACAAACCGSANAASAASNASARVMGTRQVRIRTMARAPRRDGPATLRDGAARPLRRLRLRLDAALLWGGGDLAATVGGRRARALQQRLHRRPHPLAVARLGAHGGVAEVLQVAGQRQGDEPGVAR